MANSFPVQHSLNFELRRIPTLLPGVALCAVGVACALGLNALLPQVSAMLIAIILGILVRNLVPLPAWLEPGIAYTAKRILRVGVVLLGLQVALGDILGLGAGMIVVVVAIVTIGVLGTLIMGRMLAISRTQTLLIACGFSICGAAAVAAADGVIETKDGEEVVTAVALVVLYGTVMIFALPAVAGWIGLSTHQSALWAGGSIHEVAQVVAAGGIIGGSALATAVVVKLARVLMLAPVMAGISIARRRQIARSADPDARGGKMPPIMPLFVAGFIVMVVVRSTGILPVEVLSVMKVIQSALLGAAMFALGAGVRLSMFRRVGFRPFILATASTVLVAGVALGGILLLG